MHLGRHCRGCVDLLELAVYFDIGLHAEVPLVAILRLMLPRIARLVPAPDGTRRNGDASIHDGTACDAKTLCLQTLTDDLKQPLAQFMMLQQMAEATDRAFVVYRFPT